MDRRVKERLVGATILVVLVVLIVPELLSGPKRAVMMPQSAAPVTAEPMRRVSVDLTTSKATATEETAASSASPAAEIPAGSGDASPASPVPPESTTSPATPEAAALTDSASPPPAAVPPAAAPVGGVPAPKPGQTVVKAEAVHHGWAAQLGSFSTLANAEKLERQLRGQGFSPFLSSAGSGNGLRYRVRVGPVADRAAAEKLIGRLHKAGHSASVVAP